MDESEIDEFRAEVAYQNASYRVEQGLPWLTRPVNLDAGRMRADLAAAEDPFGLDDLEDGSWPDDDVIDLGIVGRNGRKTRLILTPSEKQALLVACRGSAPAFERITEILEQMVDDVADLAKACALVTVDAAAVERKRHGAAAVCPRHGPTRGGLCRRCRR